jgi:uncharacterized delta-60 repeat protein
MFKFRLKHNSGRRSRPRRSRLLTLYLSLIFVGVLGLTLIWASRVLAAPGDFDPTFGSGGRVFTGVGNDVAIQKDGKIVVVGSTYVVSPDYQVTTHDDFTLERYNPDGSVDTTFGAGGKVTTDFFGRNDYAVAVALQEDGKIVVAGTTFRSGVSGSTPPLTILCTDDFAIARYNSNGSLDTDFDGDGKQTIDVRGGCMTDDYASDIAIQSDGKIVLVGASSLWTEGLIRDSPPDFALARLNADGSLDGTFAVGGTQTTEFYPLLGDYAAAIAMQTVVVDGRQVEKIVMAGNTGYQGFRGYVTIHPSPPEIDPANHFTLARYDPDGQLDPTFGLGGKVVVDFSGRNGYVSDVAIQPDGKIVAGGGSFGDLALVRCSPDGQLDNNFADGGKVTTRIGPDGGAYALTFQSDRKIVAVGFTDNSLPGAYNEDLALARYNPDGQLDMSFGNNGKLIADLTGQTEYANAVAIQPDDKIVVAGSTYSDYEMLLRLLGNAAESDLQVTRIEAHDERGPEGEKVRITATIANTGSISAVPSQTELLLDNTNSLGWIDTPTIPAGGTTTVSVNWDTRSVKGEHTIRVTADRTANVAESNEDNNAATLTVNVKGNKVTNGSFEQSNASGTGPAGWSGSNTGAGTSSWSEGGSDGSRSVSVSGNGGNALLAGSPNWTSDAIAVTPGEVLNLVVFAHSYGASSPATAGLVCLDTSGNVLGTVSALSVPLTTGGFATLEQLVTIPAGVAQVRVVLSGFSASDIATGGAVTFDEVGLFEN